MKNTLLLLFCILIIGVELSAQDKNNYGSILFRNPSALQREEVVSIAWKRMQRELRTIDTSLFSVWNAGRTEQIPHQFETCGSGRIENLLIKVVVQPQSTIKLHLSKARAEKSASLTFGRFVPERKDDFAWENDRIAFRMYGKALEGTNENAYGIDVWAKRTNQLVIDKWYKSGDYHEDSGEGLDYYSVGYTLGAGNAVPYVKDSLWYSRNYTSYEVLDNGPLRTSFKLHYAPWKVAGRTLAMSKTISLDAGSQLNRITVNYTYEGKAGLPSAIGVVKRKGTSAETLFDTAKGIIGYWEPPHLKNGTTGIGIISLLPAKIKEDSKHWLLYDFTEKNFTYLAGACWNKAGIFTNAASWFRYLQEYQKKWQQPLSVKLER